MWTNDDFRAVYGFLETMKAVLELPRDCGATLDTGLAAVLKYERDEAKTALDRIVDAVS